MKGNYGDLSEKLNFTPHLSKSLKVIGTSTDQSATYDFLLVFHNNYGPISYYFRDKWRYLPNFPTPLYLALPVMGVPLQIF